MHKIRRLLAKLRALVRRRQREDELAEELRFHLEEAAAGFAARGASAEEARRLAALRLGGVERVRERARRERGLPALESVASDLLFGMRMLRRAPLLTAVAVGSLALALGASASIFTVLDAVALRSLPGVGHPEQLVVLSRTGRDRSMMRFSLPEIEALARECPGLAGIGGFTRADGLQARALGAHGRPATMLQPEWITAQLVTPGFFPMLGARPLLGRLLGPDDERRADGDAVLVVSSSFWQKHLGGDPGAVGRAVEVGGRPFSVIGVLPADFTGIEVGQRVELYLPARSQFRVHYVATADSSNHPDMTRPWGPEPRIAWLEAIARLRSGVSPSAVAAQMSVVARRIATSFANDSDDLSRAAELRGVVAPGFAGVSELRESGSLVRSLVILNCGALLLVIIACVNTANLLLARGAARRKEIAIRLSQGAGRTRLVRQLLTESLLLAEVSAGMALLLAHWGSPLLVRLTSGSTALDLSLTSGRIAFVTVLTVGTALLCGVAPALAATRLELTNSLKEGAGLAVTAHGRRVPLGKVFVVVEVGLSVVLLVGAALFTRSLANLHSVDIGFARHELLFASIWPPEPGPDRAATKAIEERLKERLAALPGVSAASLSTHRLLTGNRRSSTLTVEGAAVIAGDQLRADVLSVSPDYFRTVGLALLAGRSLERADDATVRQVAVVNEAAARQLFPGGAVLGRRFRFNLKGPAIEVVGVVRDGRYRSLREQAPAVIYQTATQSGEALHDIELRTTVPPAAVVPSLRRVVAEVAPGFLLGSVDTIEEQLDRSLRQESTVARLTISFAAAALLLATAGLYGVIAFAVARRRTELGVRIALGARRGQVLGLVLRETLVLAGVGAAIGVVVALLTAQLATSWLFELSAADPLALLGAVGVVLLAAAGAGYIPARRAASLEPLSALRAD